MIFPVPTRILQFLNAAFLSDPGSSAYNVDKSATSDSLIFDQATGVFAGAAYESDPGNVVSWINAFTVRSWTGLTGN